MSKFDDVLKKIEEAMPPLAPKPVVPGQNQQNQNQQPDPKVLQQLMAAIMSDDKKQVELISQQIRNSQQAQQQKPNTPGQPQQPAV